LIIIVYLDVILLVRTKKQCYWISI